MVEVVRRGRSCARPAPASPASARSTTSGRRASRSTRTTSSTTASAAAPGGDVISFVRETEQLDFAQARRVAGRALPRDARVRGVVAGAGRRARPPRAAARAARAGDERSTSAISGTRTRGAARARLPRRAAASARRCAASTGSGSRPAASTLARKAREKGFTAAELAAAGLVNRRGNDYFAGRLLFPLADARGRVRGFQARRLREDDPLRAKYVNSPEGELFRKGELLYGLDRRAHRDREAGARDRRRGEHRRARAAAGGARAGRRVDGNGAHGAAAEGARRA